MAKSGVGSAPVGFWKFTIFVAVVLSIVQKFLVRDPNLQFLKSVPAFAVAVVLWFFYRHFHTSARNAQVGDTGVVPPALGRTAPLAEDPSPREARLERVLTADDLRRLHASKGKKANRIPVAPALLTTTVRVPSKHTVAKLAALGNVKSKTVRSKTTRCKTKRAKTIRVKRAPSRDSRELV